MQTQQYTAEQLRVFLKACGTVLVFAQGTSCGSNIFKTSKTEVHNLLVSHTGNGMRFNAHYSPETRTLYMGGAVMEQIALTLEEQKYSDTLVQRYAKRLGIPQARVAAAAIRLAMVEKFPRLDPAQTWFAYSGADYEYQREPESFDEQLQRVVTIAREMDEECENPVDGNTCNERFSNAPCNFCVREASEADDEFNATGEAYDDIRPEDL